MIDRDSLTDDDVITTNLRTWANDTILVKLVVGAMLATRGLDWVRNGELFLRHQSLFIRAIKDRSEETTIDCTLVKHDRILLIVTGIAGNGDNGVAASRQFLKSKILHRFGCNERLLRVIEHMGKSVHPHLIVGGVDTHGLLTHRTLISIPR